MRSRRLFLIIFSILILLPLLFSGIPVFVKSVPTDDWPMFRHDPAHSGYSDTEGPEQPSLLWRYEAGRAMDSSPAVVDGRVYVGSDDDYVYCLNASNGDLIWKYQTGGDVDSSPAVADGRVYVGSHDARIYCLNASDGGPIWNYTASSYIMESSPAVVDGRVYIGSHDGHVYCLDALNGDLVWSYQTGSGQIWLYSSPAVVNGRVFIGVNKGYNGYIYCLDASTGNPIWNVHHGQYQCKSPLVVNDRVYIGFTQGTEGIISCFDALDGDLLWSNYTTRPAFSLAFFDNKLYASTRGGHIYCLNPLDCDIIWQYKIDISSTAGCTPPVVVDGKAYTCSADGDDYCLDAHTGLLIWTYTKDYSPGMLSSPAIIDNKYYATAHQYIYCLKGSEPFLFISHPDDRQYILGEAVPIIEWTVTSSFYSSGNYTLYQDGTQIAVGTWANATDLTLTINGLDQIGLYNITISVGDMDGTSISDQVSINVISSGILGGMTLPLIIGGAAGAAIIAAAAYLFLKKQR